MGHERIGFLPKSQTWNRIVSQFAQFDNNPDIISKIADQTLENIRALYKELHTNDSIFKAMKFLAILSISANRDDQMSFLKINGININEISLFPLAHCIKEYVKTEQGSLEINKIACDAILESITKYEHNNKILQNELFNSTTENLWEKAGTGSNFCELARLFFASFTDRHLRYYLEREAAHNIDDFQKYNDFKKTLYEQISQHSFETAKIMQSFAAGWFNKYATAGMPTSKEISGFLKLSFEKMREEFHREAMKNK